MTRFRLGLSHLREHKFNHSFQDNCGYEGESTVHFFPPLSFVHKQKKQSL